MGRLYDAIVGTIVWPAEFLRENVVVPLKLSAKPYPYYHRRFNRVPTIDECDTDDALCRCEADMQYKRDKMVESNILNILKKRLLACRFEEQQLESFEHGICDKIKQQHEEASLNWFIKYGDLAANSDVVSAYMKQKHRLVFERRQRERDAAKRKHVQD